MSTFTATHTLGVDDDVCVGVLKGLDGRYTWTLWMKGVNEDDFYAWNERGAGNGPSFATVDEALEHCCRHLDMLMSRLGNLPAATNLKAVAP